MSELLSQLGIDWKLLLSQGVNFLLLLIILTLFVYKPLLRVMRERRKKIELGVKAGEIAELKIAEAEKIKKEKISEAEKAALTIIKEAERSALKQKETILLEAKIKSSAFLKEAAEIAERRTKEQLLTLLSEAKGLVKEAIVKTVELEPSKIDEKLIDQAINKIKKERKLI
jgi:F-type H+-transporting ATPase subunit b